MDKKEYKVVQEYDRETLQTKVNFLINNGWKLVGGICFIMGREDSIYCQAVSKSTIVS